MAEQMDKRSELTSSLIGLAFWAAIALGFAVHYFRADQADVFLDLAATPDISASGVVQFDGQPVSSGNVHIVVEGAKSKRYLGGTVVPVASDGHFEATGLRIARDDDPKNTRRVTATFSGRLQDEKKAKEISGEATAYLNFTPPWGRLGLVMAGSVAVLLMWLLYLFTSAMSRRKGRLLFGTMYFMTFLSLAVPVGTTLWFSQNSYMKELAATAPMGLVLGTAPGTTGVQWLVNIGGMVPEKPLRTEAGFEAARVADASPGGARAQLVAVAKDDHDPATMKRIEAAHAASDASGAPIHGGLTVPLYVVLLAMFGAGINMTRKVPEIQKRYEVALPEVKGPSFITKPFAATGKLLQGQAASTEQPAAGPCGMREELIRNYMYLLSAPLLAIAMYYLMQVISNGVNQPVLVLMAFATGLTSELIVSAIITFADKMLDSLRKPKEVVAVPRLLGLDREAAGVALTQAQLVLGMQTEQASASTPGIIIGQDPRGGDLVAPDTPVKLIIAKRPRVQVPHLLGLTRDDAAGRLEQMGLGAGSFREEASAASPGTVIAQDPAAGVAVDPGAAVALTLAKPQTGAVPQPVERAEQKPIEPVQEPGAGTGEPNAPEDVVAD
jgi:hypothetical protein